jgi:hypothetical protein
LRVAFSELIAGERMSELHRLLGPVEVVETVSSPDPVRIAERARALGVRAVVCDVGKRVARSLRHELPATPLLCPLRRTVEQRREFREGTFTQTREAFVGYGLLNEHGEVTELADGALA